VKIAAPVKLPRDPISVLVVLAPRDFPNGDKDQGPRSVDASTASGQRFLPCSRLAVVLERGVEDFLTLTRPVTYHGRD